MKEISYPFEGLPATGTTLPVAPGVEWLRMPLPFALNHINLWLLDEGEGGVTAVDTGFAQEPVRAAWKQILTGRRLVRCVVTHYHPDHLGLAGWLEQETGAGLWISQGDYLTAQMVRGNVSSFSMDGMLSFFKRHGLAAERLTLMEQRGNSYAVGVPAIPLTYQRLFAGQTIRFGQHDWRTIVGFGHAPEHMSLYCTDLGVLISGDMLLPTITTNVMVASVHPTCNPLKWFLDSLEPFRALPADTLVLPSHGRPFRGLHARIDQLHDHHARRLQLLLDACRSGPHNACELIPVLFDRPIPDPHQTMFAMGEAIAHLHYLEHEGRLRRIDDGDAIRFAIA